MTTTNRYEITPEQRRVIAHQIGAGNVLAISGGRIAALPDGIELPVAYGYRVRVHLTPVDDYRVERVLVRGARTYGKGERDGVYCDQVGEVAYRASCFNSYDESEW